MSCTYKFEKRKKKSHLGCYTEQAERSLGVCSLSTQPSLDASALLQMPSLTGFSSDNVGPSEGPASAL